MVGETWQPDFEMAFTLLQFSKGSSLQCKLCTEAILLQKERESMLYSKSLRRTGLLNHSIGKKGKKTKQQKTFVIHTDIISFSA